MSQKFFETEEAVRLPLGVALEHPVLELLPAVGTHETFRVELLRHGSDHPTLDELLADAALVLPPVRLILPRHFLKKSSSEHL